MAQTIPEKLPSRASQGELRLFEILKRLPKAVIVYYEPVISNRYPDFVVILPSLGVLIIEVKGWSQKEILEANPQSVRLWAKQQEVLKNHPLQQAREYKFSLMDRLREDARAEALVHSAGPHLGGFKFPFGSFAILSNITRDQLSQIPNSETVFPLAHVATRDQLLSWEELSPEAMLDGLSRFFDPFWTIQPMTANQVNIIKAILHPEILLALESADYRASEPTVKVLDLRQEAIARNIGDGHRLVLGVAGSGKTVILLSRAKLICRLNPAARVLVLCFNVPLSAMLTDALKNCSNVTVYHFDGWAKSNNVTRNFQDKAQANDHSLLGRLLLESLRNGAPDANRFDVVLIDEAQDFPAEWYQCALKAMKDPLNGELLIVGDANQGVYGRKSVSWKQLGIQAQGRTRYLEKNYRNTRPILEVAALFAGKIPEGEDGLLSSPHVKPGQCLRSAGTKPTLLNCKNQEHEVGRTVQIVCDLVDGQFLGQSVPPLKPSEIGILYRHAGEDNRRHIEDLRTQLLQSHREIEAIWLSDRNAQSRHRIGEQGVKILTMHAAKGLQFRAVIVLFGQDCPATFSNCNEDEERCLFYVALTRAEDLLCLTASKSSPFISELTTSGLVDAR